MKARAYYEQATGVVEGQPVIDLFSDDFTVWGELTDEHAACSYGQPVFVREGDGVAMGPAETPALRVVLLDMAAAASLLARALAAGFQFAESVSASVEWEQR